MDLHQLLDQPELLQAAEPDQSQLQSIAHTLLSSYLLVAAVNVASSTRTLAYFRLTEIEFYIGSKYRHDPFSHNSTMQYRFGKWYVHPSGGSRKGIDFTFGQEAAPAAEPGEAAQEATAGGILIRGLQKMDGKLIWGPSKCVDALMECLGVTSVGELKDVCHGDSIDLARSLTGQPFSSDDTSPTVTRTKSSALGFVHVQHVSRLVAIVGSRAGERASKRQRVNDAPLPSSFVVTLEDMIASPRVGIFPKTASSTTSKTAKKGTMGRARQAIPPLPVQLRYIFDLYRFNLYPREQTKGRAQLFLGAVAKVSSSSADASDGDDDSSDCKQITMPQEFTAAGATSDPEVVGPVVILSISKKRLHDLLGWRATDIAQYLDCIELGVMEYCEKLVALPPTADGDSGDKLLAPFCQNLTSGAVEKWSRVYGAYLAHKQRMSIP
ncbi:hypothetical protein RI367_001116 [Sorochytrium milnesiophthora]